jgi:Skp family chaperone for outer membrane proteins
MGEPEKTLLQQIREKEQEYAAKLEAVRQETVAETGAAQAEAESLLCTADSAGKTEAERLYWEEKGKIETGVEELRRVASADRELAAARGEKNLPAAVAKIVSYVTMR